MYTRTVRSPPRAMDCMTVRISAMPRNWSHSSNHAKPMWPNGGFRPLDLCGSSQPEKRMSCPVERLRMRSVETGISYSSDRPMAWMAQTTWA